MKNKKFIEIQILSIAYAVAAHATGCPSRRPCWSSQLFAAAEHCRLLCQHCSTVNRRHCGREELHFCSFAAAFDTALAMPFAFSTALDVASQVEAVAVSCCPVNWPTHCPNPDPDCCCCLYC